MSAYSIPELTRMDSFKRSCRHSSGKDAPVFKKVLHEKIFIKIIIDFQLKKSGGGPLRAGPMGGAEYFRKN